MQPSTKNTPIIAYSGTPHTATIHQMVESGAQTVLQHPATLVTLKRAMADCLHTGKAKQLTQLVKQAHFFKEFSITELKTVAKLTIPRYFQAGETIIHKNEPADRFYILLKGGVDTVIPQKCSDPVSLAVQVGDPFGELAVLDDSERSAWCIATNDTIALEIGSHILLDKELSIRYKILARLAKVLASRLRQSNIHQELQLTPQVVTNTTASNYSISPETNPNKEEEPSSVDTESNNNKETSHPFATPTAQAKTIDTSISSQEEYDVLGRKIQLRMEFILSRTPNTLGDIVGNKLFSYFTGGKLAKHNPHQLWSPKSFIEGSPRLKNSLHMIVACPRGQEAFQEAFLGLPLSHKVVGMSKTGCSGTFLGTQNAIDNFLNGEHLSTALQQDLEMPIDRAFKRDSRIEYLTHTDQDIRDNTLILIFDNESGETTRQFRDKFPMHQIITIVRGIRCLTDDMSSFFNKPETHLQEQNLLHKKSDYQNKAFYSGQTLFLGDLSPFYHECRALDQFGYIFATIGLIAQMGPDYSGSTWGSKGGPEGALRAARALYGVAGAQSPQDLANAVSWADN